MAYQIIETMTRKGRLRIRRFSTGHNGMTETDRKKKIAIADASNQEREGSG